LAIWATNNKFDTYSAGFINHNKDSGYTIIDIEVDNITYRIKRDFCKKKGTFKINNKTSILYRHVDLSKLVILKKDSACNAEVKSLFGDINTFLSTSMITQSIDNDILALNYKDTLETIDKSHNIQFIYHLYNLFKTAINKYKDFGKVIQSKKEVYEKLLFNGINSDVNEEVILKLTEELRILNINKNSIPELLDYTNKEFHFLSFNQWLHHHRINIISNIFKDGNQSKFLISFNPAFYESLGEHRNDYENQIKKYGFYDIILEKF
jgi:DNA repair exonuclease SbcCD ATPase subunit